MQSVSPGAVVFGWVIGWLLVVQPERHLLHIPCCQREESVPEPFRLVFPNVAANKIFATNRIRFPTPTSSFRKMRHQGLSFTGKLYYMQFDIYGSDVIAPCIQAEKTCGFTTKILLVEQNTVNNPSY